MLVGGASNYIVVSRRKVKFNMISLNTLLSYVYTERRWKKRREREINYTIVYMPR